VGNHCHHRHSYLAWAGESSSSPISSPSPPWDLTPIFLIVYGRSNPGYCLRVVCMFVLGILSLFCGEVILSDCVVFYTPLIMIMFGTSD
jgi:hypothetical protein